jgi:hypothetical protein
MKTFPHPKSGKPNAGSLSSCSFKRKPARRRGRKEKTILALRCIKVPNTLEYKF